MQSGVPHRQKHDMKRKYISKWSMGFRKRFPMILHYVVIYKMVTNIRLHQSDKCKLQFYKMLQTVALLATLVTRSIGGAYCCNVVDLHSQLSASTLGISYILTEPSHGFP